MEVSTSELLGELRILERLSSLIEARRQTVIEDLEATTAGEGGRGTGWHGPGAPRSDPEGDR